MSRSTIGLDLSYTSTGIAVFIDGAFSHDWSKTIKTKPSKPAPPYESIQRADRIAREVMQLINDVEDSTGRPASVWVEGYSFGSFANREKMGELGGIVKSRLIDNKVEYEILPVTVVRKFVCGKGNAKKEMVLKQLLSRYGIDVDSNDIADAAALAITGDHVVLDRQKQLDAKKLYADAADALRSIRAKDTKLEAV